HAGNDGLAADQRAGEVDIDDVPQRCEWNLDESRDRAEYAGIVDQDVDGSERAYHALDSRVHVPLIGHVANAEHVRPRGARVRRSAVEHRDAGAGCLQPCDDRAADATRAAGNDGGTVGQVDVVHVGAAVTAASS